MKGCALGRSRINRHLVNCRGAYDSITRASFYALSWAFETVFYSYDYRLLGNDGSRWGARDAQHRGGALTPPKDGQKANLFWGRASASGCDIDAAIALFCMRP